MPIVLIRRRAAPVGDSVPAKRIGAPGATIKPTPTDERSHPIVPVPLSAPTRELQRAHFQPPAAPVDGSARAALRGELASDSVMSGVVPLGHLLALNGGSSAGKTTLARKLQSGLDSPWLLLGIDLLMWTLPAEMVGDQGGIQIIDGEIQRVNNTSSGEVPYHSISASRRQPRLWRGIDVILDGGPVRCASEDQRRWDEARHNSPYWVAVHCDPDTAAMREQDKIAAPAAVHGEMPHPYTVVSATTSSSIRMSCLSLIRSP